MVRHRIQDLARDGARSSWITIAVVLLLSVVLPGVTPGVGRAASSSGHLASSTGLAGSLNENNSSMSGSTTATGDPDEVGSPDDQAEEDGEVPWKGGVIPWGWAHDRESHEAVVRARKQRSRREPKAGVTAGVKPGSGPGAKGGSRSPARLLTAMMDGAYPETLGLQPVLVLTFDGPVEPRRVVARARFRAGGTLIPARLATFIEVRDDPYAHKAVGWAEPGYGVAVRPVRRLPPQAHVRLELAPLPGNSGRRLPLETYTFDTLDRLRIEESGCVKKPGCAPDVPFRVVFNRPLKKETLRLDQVQVTPSVSSLRIDGGGEPEGPGWPRDRWPPPPPPPPGLKRVGILGLLGTRGTRGGEIHNIGEAYRCRENEVCVTGNFQPGQTYQITIPASIGDHEGLILGKSQTWLARAADPPPVIITPQRGLATLDPASPRLPLVVSGVSRVRVRVYAVEPDWWPRFAQCFFEVLGAELEGWYCDGPGTPLVDREIPVEGRLEDFSRLWIDLSDALPDGVGQRLVVLEPADPPNGWAPPQVAVWAQITHIGIAAFVDKAHLTVWATGLEDGQPLKDVDLEAAVQTSREKKFEPQPPVLARTDADGLATLDVPGETAKTLVARLGKDVAMLQDVTPRAGEGGWTDRIYMATTYRREFEDLTQALLIADRDQYLPGETVHLKGWLRNERGEGGLELPADPVLPFSMISPTRLAREGTARLNASGGFDLSLPLATDPPRGDWVLELKTPHARTYEPARHRQVFRVGESPPSAPPLPGQTTRAEPGLLDGPVHSPPIPPVKATPPGGHVCASSLLEASSIILGAFRPRGAVVELSAPRGSWRPGEKARLTVRAPFWPATGLLTVRRTGLRYSHPFSMSGPTAEVELPIRDDFAPNVFVRVDLVRARALGESSLKPLEDPTQAVAWGQLELAVDPAQYRLQLEIEPHVKVARPGSEVELELTVRDGSGRAAARSDVMVAVIDEAKLDDRDRPLPDPVFQLHPMQRAGTHQLHLRALIGVEEVREDPEWFRVLRDLAGESPEMPAHLRKAMGHVPRYDDDSQPTVPIDFSPRIEPDPAPTIRSAAGPLELVLGASIDAMAFYAPSIATGAEGTARVRFTLPAGEARYRIIAVAVHGAEEAGLGEAPLVARARQ